LHVNYLRKYSRLPASVETITYYKKHNGHIKLKCIRNTIQ